MDTKRIVMVIGLVLILILLMGLGVWYLFLKNQTSSLQRSSAGRALGSDSPSFSNPQGSTLSHIVAGLGISERNTASNDTGAGGTQGNTGGRAAGTQATDAGTAGAEGTGSGFTSTSTAPQPKKLPRLWHVLTSPVAGNGFFMSSTTLRFMERATGNLIDANLKTGALRRLTNTLVPKVYEASFLPDGSVVGQTLDTKKDVPVIFTGVISSATSSKPTALKMTPLGTGILSVTPSKTGKELLLLVQQGGGSSIARASWNGSSPKVVFASGVSDWRIHWLSDGRIIIVQNPASGLAGTAYEVRKDGSLSPLERSVPGLTILPKTGSTAVLVGSDNGTLSLSVRSKSDASLVTLPIRTLADKCVWAPGKNLIAYCAVPRQISSGHFLDEWYRGLIHTSDSWWKIDVSAGTAVLLETPANDAGETLDVENPVIDDSGTFIAFDNFADKSLWLLRIEK